VKLNEIKRSARCDVASFEKSPTWWRTTAPQQMYQLARSCVLQNKEVYDALMKTKTAMLLYATQYDHVLGTGKDFDSMDNSCRGKVIGSVCIFFPINKCSLQKTIS